MSRLLVLISVFALSFAYSQRNGARQFSSGAFSIQPFSNDDSGRTVVWQSDGKLVVGGRTNNGTHNNFLAIRFNPDGSLDTSFSGDGINMLDTGTGESLAHAITLDAQGRAVIAGKMWGVSGYEMGVARFTTAGDLDSTFATPDGFIKLDFGGEEIARAVAVDSNDRIVIGGYARIDTGTVDFAVSRVLSNGVLDTAFGNAGLATFDVDAAAADYGYAIAIEPSDKILIAGVSGNDFAIARLNADGSLDNTFSGDGLYTHDFGGNADLAHSILRDTSGRYYLGGRAGMGTHYDFALLRLLNTGAPDATFGTGGEVTLDINSSQSDIVRTLAFDTSGKLLAFGRTEDGAGGWNIALARFHTNGNIDTSFGSSGTAITNVESTRDDYAHDMAYQSRKIAVTGRIQNSANYDVLVGRFDQNGSLAASGEFDSSFNNSGIATVDIGTGSSDEAHFVGEDSLGRIVAIGQRGSSFAFSRSLEDGTPDTSFSTDGKRTVSIGTDTVRGGLLDSSNRLLGVGGTSNDFSSVRVAVGGGTDNTWSGDGLQTTDVGTGTTDLAYDAAEDANGRIVVVGEASNDFGVVRYLDNGTLDASFSGDGRLTTDIAGGSVDSARAVAIRSDGKIIVVGTGAGDFAIAQYLSNGSLDNSFSGDGVDLTNVGATDIAHDVALDVGNRIVLAGVSGNSFGVVRYLSNGNLDTSFASSGIFSLNIDTTTMDIAYSVKISSGGAINVAGTSGNQDHVLLRLKDNGRLDYCFASQGLLKIDGTDNVLNAVSLTWDGRILAAGKQNDDFAILKLWP